jgi:hypothetical protein
LRDDAILSVALVIRSRKKGQSVGDNQKRTFMAQRNRPKADRRYHLPVTVSLERVRFLTVQQVHVASSYRYHHFFSSGNLLPERYVTIQAAQNLRIVCDCEEFYRFLKDEFLPRGEKLISDSVIGLFQFSLESFSSFLCGSK